MPDVEPVIELRPDRWAAGGDAIGRDDTGRVVFVRGALPGETVRARIVAAKRDFARAETIDVLTVAPSRVDPPCPSRRAGCGGCGWMHLDHDAQRRAKLEVVADALRRTGRLAAPMVDLGGTVPALGYRTGVRVVGGADGRAGYRAEGSHDVVAAPACLIAHPALADVVAGLDLDPGVEVALRWSLATGELTARWDGAPEAVRGLPDATATGPRAALVEEVVGRRFTVSAGSFFQSGPAAAELIIATIADLAPELAGAAVVVDAYAGVGVLAACVTRPPTRVIALESARSAVADARHNLTDRRADVVRGEVGGWHAPEGLALDVVLADPARSGLGAPGVRALARLGAPVLVLVSCDPASLGRDTALLAASGYGHERTVVVDTFPQTTHVEAVTRFFRSPT